MYHHHHDITYKQVTIAMMLTYCHHCWDAGAQIYIFVTNGSAQPEQKIQFFLSSQHIAEGEKHRNDEQTYDSPKLSHLLCESVWPNLTCFWVKTGCQFREKHHHHPTWGHQWSEHLIVSICLIRTYDAGTGIEGTMVGVRKDGDLNDCFFSKGV